MQKYTLDIDIKIVICPKPFLWEKTRKNNSGKNGRREEEQLKFHDNCVPERAEASFRPARDAKISRRELELLQRRGNKNLVSLMTEKNLQYFAQEESNLRQEEKIAQNSSE